MRTARSLSTAEPMGIGIPILVSNPAARSFWMTSKLSSYCDHQFDRHFVLSLS
jgi:hypothetical protein